MIVSPFPVATVDVAPAAPSIVVGYRSAAHGDSEGR